MFNVYLVAVMDLLGVPKTSRHPHWGCSGRKFKSCRPDQILPRVSPNIL